MLFILCFLLCVVSNFGFSNCKPLSETSNCSQRNDIHDGSKPEIEEIVNATMHDKDQYKALVYKSQKVCDHFKSPIPKLFIIKDYYDGHAIRLTPNYVILHRCDEICSSEKKWEPEVIEVKFTVKKFIVTERKIAYSRITFKNHTRCV